jgi:hypothetical protein
MGGNDDGFAFSQQLIENSGVQDARFYLDPRYDKCGPKGEPETR